MGDTRERLVDAHLAGNYRSSRGKNKGAGPEGPAPCKCVWLDQPVMPAQSVPTTPASE